MSFVVYRKSGLNCARRVCFSTQQFQPAKWGAAHDAPQTKDWHKEGDHLEHNYSLGVDGISNSQLAFRNARLPVIVSRLPAKVEAGKLNLKDIKYNGKYKVLEAGDSINLDEFNDVLEAQQEYLSTDKDLFFEDVGLGAAARIRVGARMISEHPAHALIFRSLMINIPPRPTDYRAKFNGWNLDRQYNTAEKIWNGTSFDIIATQTEPKRGERPVIAFIGGQSDQIGIQFEQQLEGGGLAGANIVAGGQAPIRGIIEAYAIGAAAMINSESSSSLALPSLAVTKNGKTTLVVGDIDDELVRTAYSSGTLYGAYCNVLTETGVSAVFNGCIMPADKVSAPQTSAAIRWSPALPSVVSEGYTTATLNPDNFVPSPSTVVFVGQEKSLTKDQAAAKLVELCADETKARDRKSVV